MFKQPQAIRTTAKAIIIRNNHLLVIVKRDSQGLWYLLPGGGQQYGETLEQALVRECLEEIGATVEVGKLLFVRELIDKQQATHAVDMMFACRIAGDYIPQNGTSPDIGQEQVEWLQIANLEQHRLLPSVLKKILINQLNSDVYLGDVD